MALSLDLWSALLLGILYLTFQAFPIIFGQVHHFSDELTGLTFLGIGIGMLLGLALQPLFNKSVAPCLYMSSDLTHKIRQMKRIVQENNGNLPPEARLIPAQIGAVLVPISLY